MEKECRNKNKIPFDWVQNKEQKNLIIRFIHFLLSIKRNAGVRQLVRHDKNVIDLFVSRVDYSQSQFVKNKITVPPEEAIEMSQSIEMKQVLDAIQRNQLYQSGRKPTNHHDKRIINPKRIDRCVGRRISNNRREC